MPTWTNREYREIEEKAHGLFPAYLFDIEDANPSVNVADGGLSEITIRIIAIETREESQVDLVGGVRNIDILPMLVRHMSQRETISDPLPFDAEPFHSDVRTIHINSI